MITNAPWGDDVKKKLTPKNPIVPHIYGLPKIHKYEIPLSPIVHTIGSLAYKLVKFIANKLKNLVGHTDSFVKDFV